MSFMRQASTKQEASTVELDYTKTCRLSEQDLNSKTRSVRMNLTYKLKVAP